MTGPFADLPAVRAGSLPSVSREQMREVDRLMIEEFGITLLQMMENAGRAIAEAASHLVGGVLGGRRICFVVGKGNNGGGALAGARHVHNRGADIEVVLVFDRNELADAPQHQLRALQAAGVRPQPFGGALPEADLYVDGIVGYGSDGPLRGCVLEAARWLGAASPSVLALDIPTGVDPDTGSADPAAIPCVATLTLALPKSGLLLERARPFVGDLLVADIAVPRALYDRMGLVVPPVFPRGPLARITHS